MIKMREICVSFRSERQEKLFGVSRDQILLMSHLIWNREAVWGFLESRGAENLRLAE